jgi:hypothetical protein
MQKVGGNSGTTRSTEVGVRDDSSGHEVSPLSCVVYAGRQMPCHGGMMKSNAASQLPSITALLPPTAAYAP